MVPPIIYQILDICSKEYYTSTERLTKFRIMVLHIDRDININTKSQELYIENTRVEVFHVFHQFQLYSSGFYYTWPWKVFLDPAICCCCTATCKDKMCSLSPHNEWMFTEIWECTVRNRDPDSVKVSVEYPPPQNSDHKKYMHIG